MCYCMAVVYFASTLEFPHYYRFAELIRSEKENLSKSSRLPWRTSHYDTIKLKIKYSVTSHSSNILSMGSIPCFQSALK